MVTSFTYHIPRSDYDPISSVFSIAEDFDRRIAALGLERVSHAVAETQPSLFPEEPITITVRARTRRRSQEHQ